MNVVRPAILFSLMASASPLAAQSLLSEGPRVLITVERADPSDGPVLIVPDAAPLITGGTSPGVLLDVSDGGANGVVLSHPSVGGSAAEEAGVNAVRAPTRPNPRPNPRPRDLQSPVAAEEPEAPGSAEDITAIVVDADFEGLRPSQRPREVPVPEVAATPEAAEYEAVPTNAADAPATMTVAPVEAANDIMIASAITPERVTGPGPTPNAVQTVLRITPRTAPFGPSAVALPGPSARARRAARPTGFAMPRADRAPAAATPLPNNTRMPVAVSLPDAPQAPTLSAVLMPGHSVAPERAGQPVAFAQPLPDRFPLSALPPDVLPDGPESQSRAVSPPAPETEAMAAVLIGDRRPSPIPLAPMALPDMPRAGELPRDPEAGPVLPAPDFNALARMVSEAEICWQFADLSHDAEWARLSVEVALDEMNMPSTQSIRLTGFSQAVSSAAAEAYAAARGALAACAEATGAEPATRAATVVFDRDGVHLR